MAQHRSTSSHPDNKRSFRFSGPVRIAIILVIALCIALCLWIIQLGKRIDEESEAPACLGSLDLTITTDPQSVQFIQPTLDAFNASHSMVQDQCITATLVEESSPDSLIRMNETQEPLTALWIASDKFYANSIGVSRTTDQLITLGEDSLGVLTYTDTPDASSISYMPLVGPGQSSAGITGAAVNRMEENGLSENAHTAVHDGNNISAQGLVEHLLAAGPDAARYGVIINKTLAENLLKTIPGAQDSLTFYAWDTAPLTSVLVQFGSSERVDELQDRAAQVFVKFLESQDTAHL